MRAHQYRPAFKNFQAAHESFLLEPLHRLLCVEGKMRKQNDIVPSVKRGKRMVLAGEGFLPVHIKADSSDATFDHCAHQSLLINERASGNVNQNCRWFKP